MTVSEEPHSYREAGRREEVAQGGSRTPIHLSHNCPSTTPLLLCPLPALLSSDCFALGNEEGVEGLINWVSLQGYKHLIRHTSVEGPTQPTKKTGQVSLPLLNPCHI